MWGRARWRGSEWPHTDLCCCCCIASHCNLTPFQHFNRARPLFSQSHSQAVSCHARPTVNLWFTFIVTNFRYRFIRKSLIFCNIFGRRNEGRGMAYTRVYTVAIAVVQKLRTGMSAVVNLLHHFNHLLLRQPSHAELTALCLYNSRTTAVGKTALYTTVSRRWFFQPIAWPVRELV